MGIIGGPPVMGLPPLVFTIKLLLFFQQTILLS
jgi:hypothetical protein